MSDFLSWQRSGSLELSPQFQRRPLWPPSAKSYLIDTIVRGLPIPIIFIREMTNLDTLESKREVVDGQQRLRTLFAFIDPKSLSDYNRDRDWFTVKKSHNPEISGKTFSELPKGVRTRILDYGFSVHILSSDVGDPEVLQIFARLNSTGVKANHQEIRNAVNTGEFKSAMYELAYEQLERWKRWGVFDDTAIARMQEVEATSEFALLMLKGLQGKTQKKIDDVYEDNEEQFEERLEIARRFRIVMDEVDKVIGDSLPTLPMSRPAMFHTMFTLFYDLGFGIGSKLTASDKPKRLPGHMAKGLIAASDEISKEEFSDELAKALRGATSDAGTRLTRLNFLREAVSRARKT